MAESLAEAVVLASVSKGPVKDVERGRLSYAVGCAHVVTLFEADDIEIDKGEVIVTGDEKLDPDTDSVLAKIAASEKRFGAAEWIRRLASRHAKPEIQALAKQGLVEEHDHPTVFFDEVRPTEELLAQNRAAPIAEYVLGDGEADAKLAAVIAILGAATLLDEVVDVTDEQGLVVLGEIAEDDPRGFLFRDLQEAIAADGPDFAAVYAPLI